MASSILFSAILIFVAWMMGLYAFKGIRDGKIDSLGQERDAYDAKKQPWGYWHMVVWAVGLFLSAAGTLILLLPGINGWD